MNSGALDLDLEGLDSPKAPATRVSRRLAFSTMKKTSSAALVRERIRFFSNLSRLLRGGVPLLRALELSTRQSKSPRFQAVADALQRAVREGKSLSRALAEFPDVFRPFEMSVARAGEASGSLPDCLLRLAAELKRQEEIKAKVREAVAYPLFVLFMGLATLFIILFAVVPRLALIYKDFGSGLPLITRLVIRLSEAAPVFLGLIGASGAALFFYFKKRGSEFSRAVPFLRGLSDKLCLTRLSFLLGTLLKSGIPIREALLIAGESLPQKKDELQMLLREVTQGKSLSEAFRKVSFLGENERSLVLASEESGSLPEALDEMARSASEELSSAIGMVLKVLEPALILLIGLLVGFLVVSMLLPITQIDMLAGD